MPRITHVKKAQQRYGTRPVIDPATGEQKKTPMVNQRTGAQKTTKTGRPVFLRITERDLSDPKPLLRCDHCGKDIEIGTPYKHMSPKSGPYGGRQLNRHEGCPSWQPWDYSSSLSARIAQIQHDFSKAMEGAEDPDSVTEALSDAAEQVRDLANEKSEAADSLESGFGHETYQSEEIRQTADDLESWADDIEGAEVPETEEYKCATCEGSGEEDCQYCTEGKDDCGDCEGTGEHESDATEKCPECMGTGQVDCGYCQGTGVATCTECDGEEEYFDQESWMEAVQDIISIVDEAPV